MAQQVRFDENVRVTQTQTMGNGRFGMPPVRGMPQNQDFVHELGNALTQGAGPGGYLAVGTQDRTNPGRLLTVFCS